MRKTIPSLTGAKALTISPEWVMLILSGDKTVECRTWQTSYRGQLLICSSARRVPGCISGCAVALVDLVDITPFRKEDLQSACMDEMPETPSYAWHLANLRYIDTFPVKGQQRLFTVGFPDGTTCVSASDDDIDGNWMDVNYLLKVYRPARM